MSFNLILAAKSYLNYLYRVLTKADLAKIIQEVIRDETIQNEADDTRRTLVPHDDHTSEGLLVGLEKFLKLVNNLLTEFSAATSSSDQSSPTGTAVNMSDKTQKDLRARMNLDLNRAENFQEIF